MKKALKILLLILFWPFTLSYFLLKSKKSGKIKLIGMIAIWSITLAIGSAGFANSNNKDITNSDEKSESSRSEITTSKSETSLTTDEYVSSSVTTTESETISTAKDAADQPQSYKILHGELMSADETNLNDKSTLIIKAKITSSYSNTATIDQNYFNVADIIKNQCETNFDEIQYWAVADMSDGSESKVISFTISIDIIDKINNNSIVENEIGNYATDLWILPSLLQ